MLMTAWQSLSQHSEKHELPPVNQNITGSDLSKLAGQERGNDRSESVWAGEGLKQETVMYPTSNPMTNLSFTVQSFCCDLETIWPSEQSQCPRERNKSESEQPGG